MMEIAAKILDKNIHSLGGHYDYESYYLGLAEFCLRAFRRAKDESLGPHGQAVVTTVLRLEAD